MSQYYDSFETLRPADRETFLFKRLRDLVAHAMTYAKATNERLAGIDPRSLTDRAALAKLPLLRKSDLIALQSAAPPFGNLTTKPATGFRHVFMSPGPIFEPGSDTHDWWRFARALYATGLRGGELVLNCFAYHLTPAGAMFENGARALGCATIPGGIGNTEQQVDAIARLKPIGYAGTPDFLKVLLEKADSMKADTSSLKYALVSGGALFPSLRAYYADRGIKTYQCYGTADLGLIAYESQALEGMIVDEGVIVEIVRPGTGDPVPDGEVGEVVVTTLNADYPLIRFATGDLSAVMPGISPCGRTNMRLKGWLGRADQTTKIKGMFVHPGQVAEVLRRHGLTRGRLVVTRKGDADHYTLRVESADASLAAGVMASAQDVFKLKGDVEVVAPGSLPNDGKVIEDARDYSA